MYCNYEKLYERKLKNVQLETFSDVYCVLKIFPQKLWALNASLENRLENHFSEDTNIFHEMERLQKAFIRKFVNTWLYHALTEKFATVIFIKAILVNVFISQ